MTTTSQRSRRRSARQRRLGAPRRRTRTAILGQNDFLKLMIAQLQAQNPLRTGATATNSSTELAQFTQVEQTTNLANANELSGAVQLIGRTVTYTTAPADAVTGKVAERPVQTPPARPSPSKASRGITLTSITEVE